MLPLGESLDAWLSLARAKLGEVSLAPSHEDVGRVVRVGDGVALVEGLAGARLDEILVLEGGTRALVVLLDESSLGCVLLGAEGGVAAGATARCTGSVVDVPVGPELLGRVVDPLGEPLDGGAPVAALARARVERPAPGIVDRAPVTRPLFTGTTAVDAMLPLGRGQRELILGDHATGKTTLAIEAILRQRTSDVVCVYCAVGQRSSSVASSLDALRRLGAPDRTIVVVAAPDAPAGLQWLAPYAACTMAEHFAERGGDALLVLDDLTKHAQVHRQIALLLREPPGREAYPGDVFYVHARLLERAAQLVPERGGGSLTVLPVAETQSGNLSAYVPTNLISITDGQIVLDARLFNEGTKPAIDVGKSVSRVGARTQSAAMRPVAETLRLDYAQFLELELFTRIEGGSDERTRAQLERGRRTRAALVQPPLAPLAQAEQVALLTAATQGLLDALPPERVSRLRTLVVERLRGACPGAAEALERGDALDEGARAALLAALRSLVDTARGGPDGSA